MGQANRTTATVHRVISPEPARASERLVELLAARDLFFILVGRELRVRYKQTALGIAWVLLQPLVPAVIFAVVLGAFARLPSGGSPYLLFALTGMVLYGLFAGAVSRAGSSLVRDGQLITKIYFPHALLPLASGSAGVVDFLVGLGLILVVMFAVGQPLTLAVVAIPVIAALMLGLALGLGAGVAALSAHYRDFGYAVPFVLQVLLYGSPVVYSMEILPPSLTTVIALNPLVPLIEAFRWALLGTPAPTPDQILLGSASGIVMILVGMLVFARASRDMADVI